jgi:hypothetical protein
LKLGVKKFTPQLKGFSRNGRVEGVVRYGPGSDTSGTRATKGAAAAPFGAKKTCKSCERITFKAEREPGGLSKDSLNVTKVGRLK